MFLIAGIEICVEGLEHLLSQKSFFTFCKEWQFAHVFSKPISDLNIFTLGKIHLN